MMMKDVHRVVGPVPLSILHPGQWLEFHIHTHTISYVSNYSAALIGARKQCQ